MQQDSCAFHVAKESEAKPVPVAGAWNQAWNVSQHEALAEAPPSIADRDDAKMGFQRRERVVGDFRACATNGPNQSALSNVRESNEADVSHHLEFQAEPTAFAGFTGFGPARCALDCGNEMPIATTPAASASDDQPI
jgi:hypothetical protein